MRKHFFAGVLVAIPIGVIIWILAWVLSALWSFQDLLPRSWRPDSYVENPALAFLVNAAFTLGITAFLALNLSALGWASKQLIGEKILQLIGILIQRIPVIRSIYSALDQLLRAMTAGGGQQFSRVVYIEYPRKGVWALAFVTGPAKGPAAPPDHLNVFLPATPNPTSGFHLIVPESDIRESNMKVEEAFKTILSLGLAQPDTERVLPNGG